MLAGSWELGTIGKYQDRMPKAGSKAFNIREVWNQYVAMVTKLLIPWSTRSRIKYFLYKLAEISFFSTVDQNLVESMMSSLD